MPDVADGLAVGGGEPVDPFEAALEGKGVKGGGSSASLSVADGLSVAGNSAEPIVEETDDTSADGTATGEGIEGDASPLHDDPDIAALLAKYDGDTDKALAAAVEAQRQIGRQGNELGELRQTVAKLEGAVETIAKQPQVVAPSAPQVNWDRAEIEAQGEANGYINIATWAANNQPHMLESILEAWGEDEPYKALAFRQEYRDWQAAEVAKSATPSEPSKAELRAEREEQGERTTAAMHTVQAEEGFENFEDFKEYIPAALEASPKSVAKMIVATDDEEQLDGIRLVFERAQKMAADEVAKEAIAGVKDKATAGKRAAQVIRGSSGTPPDPKIKGEAQSEEEQLKSFKASLLAAESTSVADGLTYAKA